MTSRRPLLFSAFNEFVLSHHDHGGWRRADSRQPELNSAAYWVDLARLLERGRFDFLFFADVLAPYDIYRGSRDTAIASGMQTPVNDPAVLIPILAHETTQLGFVLTENILQEPPYTFARKLSTLDHLSGGRIAWNIVTSFLPGAGRNLGHAGLPSHEERYGRAEDYVTAVYKLWEASWEDDAVVADRERGIYTDPSKVHTIDHVGPYYTVPGPHLTEPSPQRTPFLFNAAASGTGIAFAGKHAEVLFTSGGRESAPENVRDLRAAAVAHGRAPEDVKIFGGLGVVVGSTEAEAHRLDRELQETQSIESILAKLSAFWQEDLSRYPLRTTVAELLNSGEGSALTRQVLRGAPDTGWDFEALLRWAANRHVVGTPEQVADEIDAWQEAGIDGLNLQYLVSPGSFADFVEQVRPVLVERGTMQRDYSPGTIREKATGSGPFLPERHPARRIRAELAAQRAAASALDHSDAEPDEQDPR
ncbi:NtaA/DmoA family FMN-dependent monooxygenase [Microbacterium sp. SORGH_AS_0888]|uniref:NtaA/DmoA family FMN-dependent monooxygenase n=1 Tax=Microbacterium sp. SORGH_AS_0888 TaxID=3041791 RepID=UPI00278B5887|nr:NtaA/DmoA family FMN-dependent monooxygenase [Microbacterium sp. SORGH_AS_0888]MDQ1130554.1 FMN-dependent oxidoreductase (nitrilotriacetate monooxygenase family) [Microbacterium sp. SORGH_AS_0888]